MYFDAPPFGGASCFPCGKSPQAISRVEPARHPTSRSRSANPNNIPRDRKRRLTAINPSGQPIKTQLAQPQMEGVKPPRVETARHPTSRSRSANPNNIARDRKRRLTAINPSGQPIKTQLAQPQMEGVKPPRRKREIQRSVGRGCPRWQFRGHVLQTKTTSPAIENVA